ncbi:MAG: hypothetical protein ACD_75C01462G0002 [uncultured bacterium]|nr:MAG: hypothetical protein ACD_75C01462G0002 [uncultured bacterium]
MQRHLAFSAQFLDNAVIEGGDAVVVEFGGDGAVNREILRGFFPFFAVALDLLADIADRVVTALFLELVDNDDVGIVKHVDLFQLRRRAVFAGHDVDRNIGDLGYF